MKIRRQVLAIDAPDLNVESTFWASMLGGTVVETDYDWHSIRVDGEKVLAIQLAPDHIRPQWPDGQPQQMHLDLYVEDLDSAHAEALALGAELLQAAPDTTVPNGFQVYADPAGHPFCLCWGEG
ncbi:MULTISPECIES: VOC family protein [Arthrobacter]|uniref:VOC family protein n=1 Tax=Arthrobacter TaxID=1663 RepID=UPI0006DB4BFC|nr:VOC family protein [Arthrobacter sp. Edens01]KPN21506.1 glyoxalase [Arthrobacter sp. Edens01]